MSHNVHCANCHRTPDEIEEYSREATGEDMDPVDYVRRNEGTFNRATGGFYCTECYIKIGMPLGVAK